MVYEQLAGNVAQIAFLVDRIWNPLAVAKGYAELFVEDENV